MKTDYLDAFCRHWKDAETLFLKNRWANADHLYGMAAECALKTLMLAFRMPFDSQRDRPTESADRRHIDDIWQRYATYATGRFAQYTLSPVNPFKNWKAEQRYCHQNDFDEHRTSGHRNAAMQVKKMLDTVRKDGLL